MAITRAQMGSQMKGNKMKKPVKKKMLGAKTAAPLMRNKMSYGGKVTKKAAGGRVRGDGICQRGKTKGEMR